MATATNRSPLLWYGFIYILYGIYYIYKDKTFNSRGLFRDLFLYLGILKKEYKFNIVDHSEGVKKKDFNCDF